MSIKYMESPADRLFKGTIVYFLGTFISKAMTILVLPLITIKLSTEEFGYYDYVLTIVLIAIPIFSLQSIEAIFRFLFKAKENEKKTLISNAWIIIIIGSLLLTLITLIIHYFIYNIEFVYFILLYYYFSVLISMYQRITRSYRLNTKFAISGLIQTLVMLIFQLVLLLIFNMGLEALFIAYIISAFCSVLYLEIYTKAFRSINFELINKMTLKEIIHFGLPLIPNNISWWAVSIVNKTLIIHYIGLSANGVFAITAKFTILLTFLIDVFRLSWQESAIVAYGEKNQSQFFSKVFNSYILIIVNICFILLPFIRIFLPYLVSEEYIDSALYIPITMLSACLTAAVGFYGAGYIASKKTKGAFWTTLIGAIINIIICYSLINKIGLYAPALSTLISYLVILIVRHFSMRSYFVIQFNKLTFIFVIAIIIIGLYLYYNSTDIYNIVWAMLLLLFGLIVNRRLLVESFIKIKRYLIRK